MSLLDRLTGAYQYPDKVEDTYRIEVEKEIVAFETRKAGYIGGIINLGSHFSHADQVVVDVFVFVPDPDNRDDGIVPQRAEHLPINVQHSNEEEQKTAPKVYEVEDVYAPYGGIIAITNTGWQTRNIYVNLRRRNINA